jgi:hypothetical protein
LHIDFIYKAQETVRHHIYDKLEYTRQSTERQNKSLLSKSFDFQEAFEQRCSETGLNLATMPLTARATALDDVFNEYNGFGVVATNDKYKLTKAERCAIANLILYVCGPAKLAMQRLLAHCKEAQSPYRADAVSSKRWLIGGRPVRRSAQTSDWDIVTTMTAEKQAMFIDRVHRIFQSTKERFTEARWNEEADYIAWAAHGFNALLAAVDGTDAPLMPAADACAHSVSRVTAVARKSPK